MKKSLFLYLFIIAALMAVFTYAYFSKKAEADQQHFSKSTKQLRDSLQLVSRELDDAGYFTVERNENAKEYLQIDDPKPLISKITNKILDMNDNASGNILIPYDKMNRQKFIINKVKVLNHRWIIADFTDGQMWGELLLKYFVEEDGSLTFERIDSQLYQNIAE